MVKKAITSSFAAMMDGSLGNRPGYTYSEKDWNPVKPEEATENAMIGYRGMVTQQKTHDKARTRESIEKNKKKRAK